MKTEPPPTGPRPESVPIRTLVLRFTLAISVLGLLQLAGFWMVRQSGPGTWETFNMLNAAMLTGTILALALTAYFVFRPAIQRLRGEMSKLEKVQSYADSVVETAVDAIITIDEKGQVDSFNPGAERIFGFTSDEAIGRNVSLLMPEPMRSEHDQYLGNYLETGHAKIIGIGRETLGRRRDGSVFPVDLAVSEMRVGGSRMFLGIVRDITERREQERERRSVEEQLRQSQKMEAIGRLAGGIAHDFNNLMTTVIGYSELLLDRLETGHPERRYVEEIRADAERAVSLTRQLLIMSRREVVHPKQIELNGALRGMEQMLRRVIGEDIDYRFDYGDVPGWVRLDSGHLEQVVLNLVVNARDAMPRGGRLSLECRNLELGAQFAHLHADAKPGSYAMLRVTDTGTGIGADVLPLIFEPFFTTKERGKGTGLGLSIVFGIVKQAGGFIDVSSEHATGASFQIYLPRVEGPGTGADSPTAREIQRRGTETVLLVEDEGRVRSLARHILEEGGYRVIEADGPPAALSIAQSHDGPIHLMLTDVIMPVMNGMQLADRIQAAHPKTKVLFMSGFPDRGTTNSGRLEEGNNFLQKPFTPRDLLSRVRIVLDSR